MSWYLAFLGFPKESKLVVLGPPVATHSQHVWRLNCTLPPVQDVPTSLRES